MNPHQRFPLHAGVLVCSALLGAWPMTGAAQTAPTSVDTDLNRQEETVVLSPFKVTTEKDNGYKATNATTGTRLNESIKDLPMPISVITEQFVRDTGATDLRQALAYTAGIQLQSQNDQGTPGGAYQGPGGVNNPEGATANITQTSYKIRGYVTDAVLRDGFRRQNSTDSVNISRVEVAFGPTALLYGIGEFGGIVNYIPKAPQAKSASEATVALGTYDFKRLTIDSTGQISPTWDFNYRVTGALEDTKDYTDYYKQNHNFISPAFSLRPTKTTQIDVDYEYGHQTQDGVGFRRVRAMANVSGGDQGEHADFYTLPGTDPYTFRWSGPDTYSKTTASNFRAQVAQELGANFHLLIGYNHSKADFSTRDVLGNLAQNVGPASLRKTVNFGTASLDKSNGDSNLNVVNGQVNDVVLQYGWSATESSNSHDQFRSELNWRFKLFENKKWLAFTNSFLFGHSEETQKNTSANVATADNTFNYKSPLDTAPIVFGKQGDGSTDLAMVPKIDNSTKAWDQSTYLVYSAKALDDRVMIIYGGRDDISDNFVHTHDARNNTVTDVRSDKAKIRTYQRGISVQLTRQISAFALKAEGVSPNFSGAIDTNGQPIGPIVAKSKEFGVKVDLWDGRVSGSVSSFKINRSGTPFSYWWSPTSNNIKFNPNKDIVYNVSNFSPDSVPGGSNGGNGAANASLTQWNAGVAAGSIYQKNGTWYVNASQTAGAAYLDAVFDYTKQHGMSWPGWLYNYDSETNNAWNDIAASKGESVIGSDQAKGWSADLMFTPNSNFQIWANYTHINKVITSAGQFAKYPYPQDKWAVWYFPNTDWGLTGKPLATVYTNAADSSTWTGIGYGSGETQDDTPEHQVAVWGNYQFTKGPMKGWSFGLGGDWMSPREYQSGITHGGGQRITDAKGNVVVLKTPAQLTVNMMARYTFKWNEHPMSVQLNVNNLLDDRKLYGLIYAPPISARVECDYRF
ncbi:MAG TPA: TonB-dependent receptor plug domain-containing protein [Lacunisphaera sp.]|nr:TonB-dependent receptor plug domain-containing protein [Lacunisphaera sp.]